MKKLKRKQPRRMTPPLALRSLETGDRVIVEVDDSAVLINERWVSCGRVTAILELAPGVEVSVKSRCINKRRVTVVSVAAMPPASS